MDIGAGTQDFQTYMRTEHNWKGDYHPFDGSIDGLKIDYMWVPPLRTDWAVAIEFIEHIRDPFSLLGNVFSQVRKGIVVTTPNSDLVDTLGMDHTHVCAMTWRDFKINSFSEPVDPNSWYSRDSRPVFWEAETASLFCSQEDSLVASAIHNDTYRDRYL